MTVQLLTTISRYQGDSGDDKPTDAYAGSTFYEVDTGNWFVWDLDDWDAYTFPLLDATSPTLPSVDEKAALFNAAAPDAANPFATIADITAVVNDPTTLAQLAADVGTPEVPAVPIAQDVVDALVTLGLITQAVI